MPNIETDDPGKTIDCILAEMPECLSMSAIAFSERIHDFLRDYSGKWVGVRYRYGADPIIVIAENGLELEQKIQEKYPITKSAFVEEHLTPEDLRIYLE